MVDILAQPVYANVPILFGGFFDTIILGFPIYLWGFIVSGLFIFFLVLIILVIKKRMDPVWGYFDSAKNNDPLAILITKNKKIRLVKIEYVSNIFEMVGLPVKWLNLSTRAAGQLGTCNTIIIDDVCGIVDDPDSQLAMMEIKDKWNDNPEHKDEHITSFEDFQALWTSGRFAEDDMVRLPPFAAVPIWEIKQYTQPVSSAHVDAWAVQEANEYKEQIEKPSLWPSILLIGGTALICLLMFIFSYLATRNV